MSIVRHKDNRTGTVYVYESESYWDKEKKQPRNRRTLIGKIDEETGEIVPTGGKGRKKQKSPTVSTQGEKTSADVSVLLKRLDEKDSQIKELKGQIKNLSASNKRMLEGLRRILAEQEAKNDMYIRHQPTE